MLLQGALIVALVVAVRAFTAHDMAEGPAPPFVAELVDGQSVTLADYAGEPLLLHFWATWCPICRLEEGEILRLSRSFAVLTVATRSGSHDEIATYLGDRGYRSKVIADVDGSLADRYQVRGVPATFVIDGDGRILFRKQGYAPPFELQFRLWLARSS
ncbi:redoxin domain-containing protein [Thioalkalicoccus limnaeus]|uniref:Redoxin domain-containing protein n=1 Tax=Thioalkalicoccus limnaeus TaxID=120681 RepID=A0ABV4B9F0_9GAMM